MNGLTKQPPQPTGGAQVPAKKDRNTPRNNVGEKTPKCNIPQHPVPRQMTGPSHGGSCSDGDKGRLPGAVDPAAERGHHSSAMDGIAERFLKEEAGTRVSGLDPMDRARFAQLVRQCAANWLLHDRAGLRVTRGAYGVALQFEGPFSGKRIAVFSLRAHHKTLEYRFVGPSPDRKRLGLDAGSLERLARLRDLYAAVLSAQEFVRDAVSVVLNGDRVPDLVPLVEETRRTLDGRQ